MSRTRAIVVTRGGVDLFLQAHAAAAGIVSTTPPLHSFRLRVRGISTHLYMCTAPHMVVRKYLRTILRVRRTVRFATDHGNNTVRSRRSSVIETQTVEHNVLPIRKKINSKQHFIRYRTLLIHRWNQVQIKKYATHATSESLFFEQ